MPDNSNYEFGAVPLDLLDYVKKKSKSSKYYFEYLLTRTKQMFHYKNLPDTIESSMLERYLQVNGICCVTECDGKLYAFNGSAGGAQDVYYRPSLFVVSNPHLKDGFSKNVVISSQLVNYNKNPDDSQPGVLMRNDSEWIGLTPLIARYAVLMAENCLTVRSADVMLRIIALITASTDISRKSAEAYLKKLESGEFGIIGDSQFTENAINMQSPPSNNGSYLTQFIELQQYLKGSFFNELGLRANYNMKREAIGQGESSLDEDSCLPLCDDMLLCRKQDVQKINDMYGTNIEVDFSSAWLENKLSRMFALTSQLEASGVGQVAASGGMMGQDGASGLQEDESEGEGNEGNGAEVISRSNRTKGSREDVLSGAESSKSDGGESEVEELDGTDGGGDRGSEETDRNAGELGQESEKSSGEAGSESGINDVVGNEFVEKIDELVDESELTRKEKGGEDDGFLGTEESAGNKESDSDS